MAAIDARKPADAYFVVSGLLGPGFFRGPGPDIGLRVQVVGPDRVVTRWDLPLLVWRRIGPGLMTAGMHTTVLVRGDLTPLT